MSQHSDRHPMGWTELIDFAFSLYRGHFRHFLGGVAIYACVDALREALHLFLWESQVYHFLDGFIRSLLYSFAMGVLLVMASEIYFERPLTIRKVFRQFIPLFSRYFGCCIAYLIPYYFWSFLSEIEGAPGWLFLFSFCFIVYFLIAWILYGPVVMLESPLAQSPMSRSRELVKGAWWRVCGIISAIYLLLLAIQITCFLSYQVIAVTFGFLGDSTIVETIQSTIRTIFVPYHTVESVSFSYAINRLVYVGIEAFTAPVNAICVMLLYFNRRTLCWIPSAHTGWQERRSGNFLNTKYWPGSKHKRLRLTTPRIHVTLLP